MLFFKNSTTFCFKNYIYSCSKKKRSFSWLRGWLFARENLFCIVKMNSEMYHIIWKSVYFEYKFMEKYWNIYIYCLHEKRAICHVYLNLSIQIKEFSSLFHFVGIMQPKRTMTLSIMIKCQILTVCLKLKVSFILKSKVNL